MDRGITFIVDDQDKDVNYICPVLHQLVLGNYINNTWTSPSDESCATDGWFEYTFSGTSVEVAVDALQENQTFNIEIDGHSVESQTTPYVSSQLADTEHTIKFYAPPNRTPFASSLDYLAIVAGSTTPLNGRTVIIDDSNDAVAYTGDWTTDPPPSLQSIAPTLYQSTTHWTSTAGNTIELSFTGESISVFGIVANLGTPAQNVTTTYILDGLSTTQGIPFGTPQAVPKSLLFQSRGLPDWEHTLLINVTDITSPQVIGIDFFLFKNTARDEHNTPTGDKRVRAGVIAGAVLGGILVLGVFLLALWRWMKRRSRRVKQDDWFVVEKREAKELKL